MSNDSEGEPKGIVAQITDNLGAVFRHLLPGVLIIGVARITHPSWFRHFDRSSWPYLAVMGVIAIAVGNAWFAINRYVLHQLVDYVCWRRNQAGPVRSGNSRYADDLAKYVREAVSVDVPQRARQHIAFRASSVLLIYTLSELSFLAAFWSETSAITSGIVARIFWGLIGVGLFIAGLWQNIITRRIDAAVLHQNLVP
jgi:hypothetical protein